MIDKHRTILHIIAHPTMSELRIGQSLSFMSAVMWVICLLWPGETMQRPTYHVMSAFGDDVSWAIVFILVSLLQGTRLLVASSVPRKLASVINGVVAFIWVFTSISMIASVYPPPAAIAGEIVVTIASVWVFAHFRSASEKEDQELGGVWL